MGDTATPLQIQRFLTRLFERYDESLLGVAEFLVVFALLYALGRLLVEPTVAYVLEARRVEPTAASALERLTRTGILVGAVVLALSAAGFGYLLERSALIVAAATVALGFAAQDVVANFVSGAFIVTDRKFNIGDWIRWDDKEGVIEDISFRATRVRTFNNEVVTVPNSELTTSAVTNPVIRDRLRIQAEFGIGYDDDVDRAREIMVEEGRAHGDVLDDPPPSVRLIELGDDDVVLEARIWIRNPARSDFLRVRSEYVQRVKERLQDAGIDPSPPAQQELSGRLGVDEIRADRGGVRPEDR